MIYKLKFKSNRNYNFITYCNGSRYRFHLKYDVLDDSYYLDIDKLIEDKYSPFIQGIKLNTFVDLFISYKGYNLGTFIVVSTDSRYAYEIPRANTITKYFEIIWEHD